MVVIFDKKIVDNTIIIYRIFLRRAMDVYVKIELVFPVKMLMMIVDKVG